jgi:hypothetical protein
MILLEINGSFIAHNIVVSYKRTIDLQ